MENSKFKVTLCVPVPRVGFGKCDTPMENEFIEMERFLQKDGDIIVFPEGFLRESEMDHAVELVKKSGKWVILGTESAEHYFTITIISPVDGVVYQHRKTALTEFDRTLNPVYGTTIDAYDLPMCRIGTPLCYEIHFPEISRIMALEGAKVLFNCIGTGMWHRQQFLEWNTIARARAIENRAFVVGCTHFCDPIPMAYAYGPDGNPIGMLSECNDSLTVTIDLSKITERDYLRDRTPDIYGALAK